MQVWAREESSWHVYSMLDIFHFELITPFERKIAIDDDQTSNVHTEEVELYLVYHNWYRISLN